MIEGINMTLATFNYIITTCKMKPNMSEINTHSHTGDGDTINSVICFLTQTLTLFIQRNWLLWVYNSVSDNEWLISPHLLLLLSGHSEGKSQRVKFAWGKQLSSSFVQLLSVITTIFYLVDRTFCNVRWKYKMYCPINNASATMFTIYSGHFFVLPSSLEVLIHGKPQTPHCALQ